MKHCFCLILFLQFSPLLAKDKRLDGYILDAAAFREVEMYCVDTHNLPPREVAVINQFVSRESRPRGLLARLPWHRVAICQEGGSHAIVRLEFPTKRVSMFYTSHDVNGALLVFKAGSPTPIYETREVPIESPFSLNSGESGVQFLEHAAISSVVRILIHDCKQFSEAIGAGAL
jgi:hypothetical protein